MGFRGRQKLKIPHHLSVQMISSFQSIIFHYTHTDNLVDTSSHQNNPGNQGLP